MLSTKMIECCAWSMLGGAGVLASPFQAMHGLASPLTAAYGSAPVGGRPFKIKEHTENMATSPFVHLYIALHLPTISYVSHLGKNCATAATVTTTQSKRKKNSIK